jgi:hypothetical protein
MHAARRVPIFISVVVLLALMSTGAALAAPGGNSAAAHACQKGGHTEFTRADGTTFRNAGECTSYAARGGTLVPVGTARFWIEWEVFFEPYLVTVPNDPDDPDDDESYTVYPAMRLYGEGLLPGSTVGISTALTGFEHPFVDPAIGHADVAGDFLHLSEYQCWFVPTITLTGVAANGQPVTSGPITAPCP